MGAIGRLICLLRGRSATFIEVPLQRAWVGLPDQKGGRQAVGHDQTPICPRAQEMSLLQPRLLAPTQKTRDLWLDGGVIKAVPGTAEKKMRTVQRQAHLGRCILASEGPARARPAANLCS